MIPVELLGMILKGLGTGLAVARDEEMRIARGGLRLGF